MYSALERKYFIEPNAFLSLNSLLKGYLGSFKMVVSSLCVKDYSDHFTWIISFNFHNKLK